MSKPPCRFWQQGNCRYGDNCKFDHPGARTQQSSNRYGALSSANQTQMSSQRAPELPYNLSKELIRRDLTEDRPPWPLSCYGPGRDAPELLFGGYPREQSYEEIRLHYMQGELAGNPQGAINEIEALHQSAQQQIQTALGNLDGAIQYIVDAGNKHPNRIDVCAQSNPPGGTAGVFAVGRQQPSTFGAPSNAFGGQSGAFQKSAAQQPGAFGAPSAQPSGAFGQPSAMGQRPSAFGVSAFGQPSQPAPAGGGAFGKPSQPASAFGQPSAFGAKPSGFGAPAFGQAAQPAGGSAFGQPSQPGSTPAFGQPSQPGATPAFGQPSQPGATPAFGQPSQPGNTPSFGQPSQPGTTPAFGQPSQPASAFGQASSLGQKPNPFSPNIGTSAGPSPSPFGQPSQPQQQQSTSPFGGQPSQPAGGAFGQSSALNPFAKPTPVPTNPFGQQQQPNANPFGPGPGAGGAVSNSMDTATNGIAEAPSPFGAPSAAAGGTAPNPFQPSAQAAPTGFAPAAAAVGAAASGQAQGPYAPTASRQHPPIESYSAKEPDGRLRMFKGKAVVYEPPKNEGDKEEPVIRNFDGSLTKIWFPNGAPPYNPDTEGAAGAGYDEKTLSRWKAFAQTGRFDDGVMPEVPPMREFCTWDF